MGAMILPGSGCSLERGVVKVNVLRLGAGGEQEREEEEGVLHFLG